MKGGRDAFYRGEIAKAIVDYCQKNGGFLSMEDFAAQKSTWVEPISTTYRGHTLYELPPNNQGLTALLILNILEALDLKAMRGDAVLYYHTLVEATQLVADRVEVLDGIAARFARNIDQVHEDLGALDVPQELMSQPMALVSALDQAGHVGDDEAPVAAQ